MKSGSLFEIEEVTECMFDHIDVGYSLTKEQSDNLESYLAQNKERGKAAILKCVSNMLDEFQACPPIN